MKNKDLNPDTIRKKYALLTKKNKAYQLNPVTTLNKVRTFEKENDVILPEDYVWFITNVANGGIWMDGIYRFYPLEKSGFDDEELPDYEPGAEKYALEVLSLGCTYGLGIILDEAHFGKMTSCGDCMARHDPDCPEYTFTEFFIKWLDEAVLGYNQHGCGERVGGTIDENLADYEKTGEIQYLTAVRSKLTKELAKPALMVRIRAYFKSEQDMIKRRILGAILMDFGNDDQYAVIKAIFAPENYVYIILHLQLSGEYYAGGYQKLPLTKRAGKYYPMLVTMLRFFAESGNKSSYEDCLQMMKVNPRFREEDVL